jgi:hypothetical protein
MALALLLLAGCEIETVGIPRTEALISLHGVLSASARTQVVLLERTRNGSVDIVLPPFDLNDPIGSDEGIAESGAIVRLTTPSGDVLVAREDVELEGDGRGAGIYRFALPGDALERNAAYRLSVQTRTGEVLTGETSVPAGAVALTPAHRVFDRAHDTVVVAWPAAAGARSYFVRIETPFGPRSFFTDSTRVRLVGALRNVELSAMPRVFIPGFPQAVTVSAVDSNYYHWYRTHNDALSGTGLIHSVRGGLGVFGSLVRLRFENFDVVVPQSDPEAGVFRFSGSAAEQDATHILGIELYVESRAVRSDQADALSGRYHKRPRLGVAGCITCGVLGSTRDGRIELALLSDWYARDTADVLIGEIRGDTIIGRYRAAGGIARFVKQR